MPAARFLIALSFVLAVPHLARAADTPTAVRVLVWDERQKEQKQAYPGFLGDWVAEQLAQRPGIEVQSVGIDDPEQGLSQDNLENADVLIWWGHLRHGEISSETAKRILTRIAAGKLALIPLHSGLSSKPFIEAMRLKSMQKAIELAALAGSGPGTVRLEMTDPGPDSVRKKGTPITPSYETSLSPDHEVVIKLLWPACSIGAWQEDGKPSHLTVLRPNHPIAAGLPRAFDLPETEMYDEPFQVPEPDVVIFEEKWDSGEQFRSGCLWRVGLGQVFYFRPGHETYPVFTQAETLKVLENAVRWLAAEQANHH